MKLLPAKKRKIAIIFTGGLGDTLLYMPLLKELRKKHFHITCIFYSRNDIDFLLDSTLTDRKFHIKNKVGMLAFALTHPQRFVNFYINHLAQGKLIKLAAKISSARITQTSDQKSKDTRRCRKIAEVPLFTYAEQNLHLLYTASNSVIRNIQSFYFPTPLPNPEMGKGYLKDMPPRYYIVQVSCGNNMMPFKNWPVAKWAALINRLCINFRDISFVLAGDNAETSYTHVFENLRLPNCRILIGKTSVPELFNLLAHSEGYIGLDSGLMHLAAALQKKSLAIFGASNEKLLGYHILDKSTHAVIASSLYCRPCSSYKNANTSRVSDPMLCPDFACLATITEEEVYKKVLVHFNLG